MSHYMLDLETLDIRPTAIIVAVGCVRFDPRDAGVRAQYYAVANDWHMQARRGRTMSPDTVAWWLGQEDKARSALINPAEADSKPTDIILSEFSDFVGADAEMWGNGADFDCSLMGSLYESYLTKRPWTYSKNRCFRTMKSLHLPREFVKPERKGTHHNALDDAVFQVEYLQAIYKALSL